MPTMRGRERLARLAIECWTQQDYDQRELVIVVDEGMQIADLPEHSRVISTPGLATIGEKRNAGISAASGDLIAIWDDDDWQADWRLSAQAAILEDDRIEIVGCDRMLYVDLETSQAARYWFVPGIVTNAYLVGGTMMFRRRFWSERPFEASSSGEDNRFVRGRMGGANVATMADERFYVAMRHGQNTSHVSKTIWGVHPQWEEFGMCAIYEIMGAATVSRWRNAAK